MTSTIESNTMPDTKASETPQVNSPWQFAYQYANKHGGLVFGLIATLTIYLVMVQPELTRNAVQNELLHEALRDMKAQTDMQKELAMHMKTTAQILDRITTRLDENR